MEDQKLDGESRPASQIPPAPAESKGTALPAPTPTKDIATSGKPTRDWRVERTAVITALCTFLFGIPANFLGQYFASDFARDRQVREAQERAYVQLLGYKTLFAQVQRDFYEGRIMSEFYNARFDKFSRSKEDRDLTLKYEDVARSALQRESEIQQALFETLGSIRVSFQITEDLTREMDALYENRILIIKQEGLDKVKTEAELSEWKIRCQGLVEKHLEAEFANRIVRIATALKEQLEKKK